VKKLSMALCVLAAAAPAIGQQTSATAPKPTSDVHGINPADMNPSVAACQDFDHYANGGWMKANAIPSDQSEWGSFSVLEEQNRESLHKVLEKVSKASNAPGTDDQKVGDFYAACMDEAAIEAQGAKPLQKELAAIDGVGTAPGLDAEIARLQLAGVNAVFNFGSDQDRKNASEVIAGAYQGGLGLPDRDYYTKTDDESKKLRDEYVAHVTKMLTLLGEEPGKASEDAKAVLSLETKLAEASMTRVERRNPDNTYHRKTLDEVAKLTPNFSWSGFLKDLDAPTVVAVNVGQPAYFEAVNRELSATPLPAWKAYLRWHLVHSAAPSLSKAFVEENFNFYGKTLQGTPENEVRWKRCVSATDDALGFALGKVWVRDYFPPDAKARADAMVKNLVAALRADLKTLSWMGDATRKEALSKLDAFDQKIGYPDKWRDYSKLSIDRGAYLLDVQRANDFEYRRDLAKIGKPVDRTEWEMSPPTVNAYYSAQKNEIVFPAGILQPPFFDAKADDAVNYGAIGAVIGHEMTHGFDDQGRKFDAQGNQRDWWTADDLKNYQTRSKCVEDQYDSYVFEGQHTNGKLVLGEATADLGGLAIAHRAYRMSREGKPPAPKIDGLTDDQRLFLAWAHVWAANIRPEFAKLMLNTNPHPLPQFRASGPPSTLPEFAKAFGCKAGDPMVRQELCQIW
jgi:predicted metalloendopeptidase